MTLEIAILGCGPIAAYVTDAVDAMPEIRVVAIMCREQSLDNAQQMSTGGAILVHEVEDLPSEVSLLVDCAGPDGLAAHGPAALRRGIEIITVSISAFADPDLHHQLDEAAKAGGTNLKLLSGAVGGLDALSALAVEGLQEVSYVSRKPPRSWKGSPAERLCDLDGLEEPFVHFRGTARDAATAYPKNANVAAAIALAGLGMDRTKVTLIADPGVDNNIHEIEAKGEFGHLNFRMEGKTLPDNPRSSALAAMSVVEELRRRVSVISF